MQTKEVVEKTGISKDTLRYYEELGILSPNRESYAREYSDEDIERLQQIKLLKDLSFTLSEVKQFVDFDEKYQTLEEIEAMSATDRDVILELMTNKIELTFEKIDALEEGLEKLQYMRDKILALDDEKVL